MQSLEVISLNIWQILISLCNLLILFLLMKKFLYKPVRKMLSERQKAIDDSFEKAKEAENDANESKRLWNEKLKGAETEAGKIIKSAVTNAEKRSDEIIFSAKEEASYIKQQAQNDIELEKKKAEDEIKNEIADVSAALAGKLLEREINESDHRAFVNNFIDNIGEADAEDN